jgi:hypothetical protein
MPDPLHALALAFALHRAVQLDADGALAITGKSAVAGAFADPLAADAQVALVRVTVLSGRGARQA